MADGARTGGRRQGVALPVLVAALGLAAAASGAKRLELSDFAARINVSEPQIRPGGAAIVVVVSRPDFEENRWQNELLLVAVEDGATRVLTRDRPAVRHPRWSPDGSGLAFLDLDPGEHPPRPQIFVMPMTGGDPLRITSATRGVLEFAWSPDGASIVYVSEDEPAERQGDDAKHNRSFEVGRHDYLATAAPSPRHLWRLPAAGGEADRLTSGPSGATGFIGASLAFAPDGSRLAFTSQPLPHSGEIYRAELELLELDSGERRRLLPDAAWGGTPAFSTDGRWLAYSAPRGGEFPIFDAHSIFVLPAAGGEARNVTANLDRGFYGPRFLDDENRLLLGGYDGTRTSLWVQELDGAAHRLDLGDIEPSAGIGPNGVDVGDGGELAFVGVEPLRPQELYYLPTLGEAPLRLTDLNAALAALDLGSVEAISWRGPDGFEEDGVLVFPPDFRPQQTYPLVLLIHGGPMGASTRGFSFQAQQLAGRGWVVFSPNYRGSGNLGSAYQRAVVDDAGDGPGRDVMAGLAAVVARGFVDESRIAVSGWSYGGYMTTWLIGHFPGWRAAVAGAAVTDYADSYSLSDMNRFFGFGFGYSPWSARGIEEWRRQSPIYKAHEIRTPTLILSNTGDLRVPITQSYKLYHALLDNGVPVQFVAYPVGGHFPADPVHQRDVYRRWEEWIERHFTAEAASGE